MFSLILYTFWSKTLLLIKIESIQNWAYENHSFSILSLLKWNSVPRFGVAHTESLEYRKVPILDRYTTQTAFSNAFVSWVRNDLNGDSTSRYLLFRLSQSGLKARCPHSSNQTMKYGFRIYIHSSSKLMKDLNLNSNLSTIIPLFQFHCASVVRNRSKG